MFTNLNTAAMDAVDDFMRVLNDHIEARVRYDLDGARYRGDNPPDQDDVAQALTAAILAVVRARDSV